MTTFASVVANDLEEVHMIAGDYKTFIYTVYDESGSLLDLSSATCSVAIFKYGDAENIFYTLPGSVIGMGKFSVTFTSACSINLSGVYQQQPKIVDYLGNLHIPSQGKLVIFPSA